MQFKFSVWSSKASDKLDISDRVIIWLAGLIRGRVLANYICTPCCSSALLNLIKTDEKRFGEIYDVLYLDTYLCVST